MPADLLLSVVLLAAQGVAQSAAQQAEQITPLPDPELLEFLGSFETEEGEWVDPLILAEVDVEAAEQKPDQPTAADEIDASEQHNTAETAEDGGEQP